MKRMLAVLAAAAAVLSAAAPAHAAGASLKATPAAPSAASGVYFTVSGGGNRASLAVAISCVSGGTVVYDTFIPVVLDAKGAGTSQTVYPPASSCTADLEIPKQQQRARVLTTITFSVTP